MNVIKEKWTDKEYREFRLYLKELQDIPYRDFHQKLTSTKYEIIGIKVPIQRKIAKEILKGNSLSFLKVVKDQYYEEVNIEGFVIAGLQEKEVFDKYFQRFLPKIDNWAICDNFCSSIKRISKYQEEYLSKIKELIKKDNFYARVGFVLLLNNYVEKNYLPVIFELVHSSISQEYYVNMAIAWLIAECFIKFPKETFIFIKQNQMNSFCQNKTIQKICESYRVSKEMKEKLKKYQI